MAYCKKDELLSAPIYTLRELAKESKDEEVLDWLAKQDDPIILENVAKNICVDTKTIDGILVRLDEVAEKIEKENLEVQEDEVYDGYCVDLVDSKAETFKTRIYFACGWNPQTSSTALDSIMRTPIKVLIRRIGYHRLDNFLLCNPRISKESIQWILDRPILIGPDTVRFLRDADYLHQLANQIITLYQKKNWFSEQAIHRILIEFGRNTETSGETIDLLVRFAKNRYSEKFDMKLNRLNEELMGFAKHKKIFASTLDMLALGLGQEIRDAVAQNENTSEETHRKLEYMKHTM